ncbi:MAG: NlpC/P60 family protein [Eubacteriales bacterium]|nr:NlpC/P60 family protein [Eubacteriales bacterium]
MKNKYLTKCLCITLLSAMVLSSPMAVMAAEGTEAFASEDFTDTPGDGSDFTPSPVDPTPVPDTPSGDIGDIGGDISPTPDAEPTPTPGEDLTPTPEPTPTPGEDVTPTPEPTPTPGEVTPTPEPSPTPTPPELLPENVRSVVDKIQALVLVEITLEHKPQIEEIRKEYEALTDDEKAMISDEDYNSLVRYENAIAELEGKDPGDIGSEPGDPNGGFVDGTGNVLTGTPVYYTNMVSNLHAGKDFYLDSLKDNYQLTFSEDFASVMDEIEKEYKAKNKLTDASDLRGDGMTTSADTLLVRNWQDIIAVYVYEQNKSGADSYNLDASAKEDLAAIFAEMNPVVRDKQNITLVTYGNRHINYYIKKNKISKKDRAVLKKYVEADCKLLCATVTAAKGFVRQSVGEDVSEERVNVIAAAYTLVGKVGYFWGGKSTVIGEDPSWGTVETVSAAGSNSSGTMRAYGLDCSGFVTWAVINGYKDQAMQGSVGDGTSDQWEKANVVSEEDAQPGDLVFQRGPEAGSDNHVGILCGKTEAGDWIAVHCSSSKNGVTVGEAYGASFRYIRQPSFYPSDGEVAQMVTDGAAGGNTDITSGEVTVSNTLQDVIATNQNAFSSQSSGNTLTKKPLVDTGEYEVFVEK